MTVSSLDDIDLAYESRCISGMVIGHIQVSDQWRPEKRDYLLAEMIWTTHPSKLDQGGSKRQRRPEQTLVEHTRKSEKVTEKKEDVTIGTVRRLTGCTGNMSLFEEYSGE